ncbi:F-box/FBD/LRR-repeat protein family [Arachis hypogaea]|uniref:F-box/FBD/LRR-repeat protein family n=1 Tax=Arachis hypogaea TaxID=3818 RepID=A0A6B9V3W7_ARAHY|nr:F-box/FBD/LRR-repeat protein family [Arachis hypogaea]
MLAFNLWSLRSPNKWLLEQFYRNPFLETLMLHIALGLRMKDIPAISFMRISNQLELNVHFGMNNWHLYSLREFLQNIKPQKVLASLSLFIREPYSSRESLGVLQVSAPPPSIKHVQLLRFRMNDEAHYFPLMNWLLSSCFPKTISFSLDSYFNMKAFIVFFYEMLMERERGVGAISIQGSTSVVGMA